MVHSAAGDSEDMLRIFLAVVLGKMQELQRTDGIYREISDECCFLALDSQKYRCLCICTTLDPEVRFVPQTS
jgi:ribosomal protein L14